MFFESKIQLIYLHFYKIKMTFGLLFYSFIIILLSYIHIFDAINQNVKSFHINNNSYTWATFLEGFIFSEYVNSEGSIYNYSILKTDLLFNSSSD